MCSNLNVDGIRGDIVATRSSRALAAFEGHDEVGLSTHACHPRSFPASSSLRSGLLFESRHLSSPSLCPTSQVTVDDIGRVITMSLRHRLRKDPLSNIDSGERVGEEFERVFGVPAEKTRQDVPPHGTRW